MKSYKIARPKISMRILLIPFMLLLIGLGFPVWAEVLPMSDSDLEGVSAKGEISIGSYQWNDDHAFDASTNKGAIFMDGYVQSNVTAENLVNATQSAISTGVTTAGDINSNGGSIIITNTNESTAFVGGF